MAFKRWLISAVMAALALFFSVKAVSVWTARPEGEALEAPAKPPLRSAARPAAATRPPALRAYKIVAARNLFTPDRRSAQLAAVKSGNSPAPSRRVGALSLEGVIIHGDQAMALVRPGGGRNAGGQWVHVGDAINQLEIVAIEADRILVREGSQVYEVPITKGQGADGSPVHAPPSAAVKRPTPRPQAVHAVKPVSQKGQPPAKDPSP